MSVKSAPELDFVKSAPELDFATEGVKEHGVPVLFQNSVLCQHAA